MDWSGGLIALAIGGFIGVLLSGLIAAVSKAGWSPLPKPLCVAFMEAALHRPFGLGAGLAFHVLWVAFWSVFYVFLFWNDLSLLGAAGFAVVLWLLSMIFFFPSVGWGYFGWKTRSWASLESAAFHVVFAVLIWGFNAAVFQSGSVWRAL